MTHRKEEKRKRLLSGRPPRGALCCFLLVGFFPSLVQMLVAGGSMDFKDDTAQLQLRRRLKSMDSPKINKAMVMEENNNSRSRQRSRKLIIPKYADKHHFNDCVGKTIDECQIIVDAEVQANPEKFGNQTTLHLSIRKVREKTDSSYYKVVLRTNTAGTRVYGIFDDGVVYYPWPWKVNGQDTDIGPWDCDEGVLLSPEECCAKIQADVPMMDDNGNFLACFVEEPVGGPHNPERSDRVIVVTDGTGKIVRAPVAH